MLKKIVEHARDLLFQTTKASRNLVDSRNQFYKAIYVSNLRENKISYGSGHLLTLDSAAASLTYLAYYSTASIYLAYYSTASI